MEDIISQLSNYGFPVVACGCLGYFFKNYLDNQLQAQKEERDKERETQKDEKERLYTIIDRYNENLGKACEVLDRLESKFDILKENQK